MTSKYRLVFSDCKDLIIIVLGILLIIWWITLPDYESRRYRTGPEVMAERWKRPEPNDPNFLADYRKYIGYEWSEE